MSADGDAGESELGSGSNFMVDDGYLSPSEGVSMDEENDEAFATEVEAGFQGMCALLQASQARQFHGP